MSKNRSHINYEGEKYYIHHKDIVLNYYNEYGVEGVKEIIKRGDVTDSKNHPIKNSILIKGILETLINQIF